MRRDEARKRARELTAKMTLEEKASQMLYESPAIRGWGFRSITGGTKRSTASREPVFPRCSRRRSGFRPPSIRR